MSWNDAGGVAERGVYRSMRGLLTFCCNTMLTAHASPVSHMYDHDDIVRAYIDTYTYSVYVEST